MSAETGSISVTVTKERCLACSADVVGVGFAGGVGDGDVEAMLEGASG
jgi:hypothetical protein